MNEFQKVQRELLKTFVSVCDELGIKYYLAHGSVLGAVKYNGFIPWDDDIDVQMFREDYECFMKLAPEKLPEWCFLQSYKTDEEYPNLFAKLRDSRTTWIETYTEKLYINQGIFIDIFPIDGYPEKKYEQRMFLEKIEKYERIRCLFARYNSNWIAGGVRSNILYIVNKIFNIYKSSQEVLGKYEKICKENKIENCRLCCTFISNPRKTKSCYPIEWFGKGRVEVFEGINVVIPEKYDEYLTYRYGDWRADLPEEEKYGHHFCVACDTKKSYLDYVDYR